MKAIILAGGKGTRLKPYTTHFPKPLMPIGERPILEIVIRQLKESFCQDIIIMTGHMGEMIRAFFENGERFGVNISYSMEDEPLGTAGPLNLIREQLTDTFLLMNGDVLSDIDFNSMLTYHKDSRADATIALSKREVNIDFGVVEIDELNFFSNWEEKPTIEYQVSTGIYLFEAEALESLPKEGYFNLPDFIMNLHKDNKKVLGYIHQGYWLDIGRTDDYEKACSDYEDNKINC